ncbi:PfkB family carbohydrate kinase [Saccharopolyspora sp. K220]|uniref:PfkB family carbohydrate kinase n=1 Tax=Saccharopolyspora soli TaxID=2926618 RepID=UPI001F5870AE|nr:PfkB family carbohydrate kinase [Saccharopolyspora soli]MCI2417940.1 PfkB family carbohydrate kinase [Saccharopolyspora soli]
MNRLVHLGNVLVDLVMTVPQLPPRGGDVLATSSRMMAGGGFNVMVAAARQGMHVAHGGLHGTGPLGDLVRKQLDGAGIELLQAVRTDQDTGYDVALVDAEGERTFVTSFGVEATLGRSDLARITIKPGDFVYVSGYSLVQRSSGPALAEWMRQLDAGVPVVVDPGPLVTDIAPDVLAATLRRAHWWSCNLREATLLTGREDPAEAAVELVGRGCSGVVVRTGPDGCVLATDVRNPVEVLGFRVSAVDTNGAGDAHVGAFIACLARGLEPAEAARYANVAAALAVTKPGPATAPTATEIDDFLTRRAE